MYNPDAAERLFEPEALQTTPVADGRCLEPVMWRYIVVVHAFLGVVIVDMWMVLAAFVC